MRRPVGVKWVLLYFRWTCLFFGRVAADAILPSALSRSDFVRSVQVGRSRFSRCCHLIAPTITPGSDLLSVKLTGPCPSSFRHCPAAVSSALLPPELFLVRYGRNPLRRAFRIPSCSAILSIALFT